MIWIFYSIRTRYNSIHRITTLLTKICGNLESISESKIILINDTEDQVHLSTDETVDVMDRKNCFGYLESSLNSYYTNINNMLGNSNWSPARGRNWGLLFLNQHAAQGDLVFFSR